MRGRAVEGTDVAFWYLTKRNMQGATDVAAVNAAVALGAGNTTGYATEAIAAAAQRGFVNGTNGVTVNVYSPLSSDPNVSNSDPYYNSPNTVEVVISQTQSPMLSAMVGAGNVNVGSRSVAQYSQQTYCMLALNNTGVTGVLLNLFFSDLNMPNCSIGDNATGGNALTTQGFLWQLNAFTATVGGAINNGCFFGSCALNWTLPARTNATAPIVPILDPYSPTGATPRTMPTPASVPTITAIGSVTPVGLPLAPPPTVPSTCTSAPNAQITASKTVSVAGCYLGINITGSGTTVTFTGAGPYTIVAPTANAAAITIANGAHLVMNSASFTVLAMSKPSSTFVVNNRPAISMSGGTSTMTLGSGNNTIYGGGSSGPAVSLAGGTLTINSTTASANTILGQGTSNAVNLAAGTTMTIGTTGSGITKIQGGSGQPAISTAGTFTINSAAGDSNSILGQGVSNGNGVNVTGGSFKITGGTNIIEGGAGSSVGGGIAVTGGTVTIGSAGATTTTTVLGQGNGQAGILISSAASNVVFLGNTPNSPTPCAAASPGLCIQGASGPGVSISAGTLTIGTTGGTNTVTTNSILGRGSGNAGIAISGGSLKIAGSSTNNIQSGSSTAVNLTSGTLTIGGVGATATNNILAQASGQSAINISNGTVTIGSGTSVIQGGTGAVAVSVIGTGNLAMLDGMTAIIGPSVPTVAAISSAATFGNCGFGFAGCTNQGLTLGAGTYTLMGGLLSPAAT
jgi:hypothetical protein